jgi:AraC-like DNA-binding protein
MNFAQIPAPVLTRRVPHPTAERVRGLLRKALQQIDATDAPDRDACARYIVLALQIHTNAVPVSADVVPSGLAAWQIRVVHEMALANLDAALSIRELAAACRLSRGYFTRAFNATFGVSPHRWRHGHRLDHARTLLRTTDGPIAEIAISCGFNDQAHFTRAFKTATNVTPHAFRRQCRSRFIGDAPCGSRFIGDPAAAGQPAAASIAAEAAPTQGTAPIQSAVTTGKLGS